MIGVIKPGEERAEDSPLNGPLVYGASRGVARRGELGWRIQGRPREP